MACRHLFVVTCVCIHGSVRFVCSALQRRDRPLERHSENREPAGRAAQVGVEGMVGEEKEGRGGKEGWGRREGYSIFFFFFFFKPLTEAVQ